MFGKKDLVMSPEPQGPVTYCSLSPSPAAHLTRRELQWERGELVSFWKEEPPFNFD